MAKSQCATCGEWFEDSELDGHLNTHLEGPTEEPGATQKRLKCPDYQTGMEAYYGVPFLTQPIGHNSDKINRKPGSSPVAETGAIHFSHAR